MEDNNTEFAKRLEALAREINPAVWLESAFSVVNAWASAIPELRGKEFRIELVPANQHGGPQLALHADNGFEVKAFGYYRVSNGGITYTEIRTALNQSPRTEQLTSEHNFQNHLFGILERLVKRP